MQATFQREKLHIGLREENEMQDFRQYDYTISAEGIEKAVKAGLEVMVIINGEYYEVVETKEENQK